MEANTGRSSRPRVSSHTSAPKPRAAVCPSRRSPPQTPKESSTQAQPPASTNRLSARVVRRGRRGRRKPYQIPSRHPRPRAATRR